MLSSYFLEVHTGNDYNSTDYDRAAGELQSLLVTLLSDPTTLNTLTHDAPRMSIKSSIETGLEDAGRGRELIAKVVLDVHAANPVKFDKGKWSKMLKARPEYDAWLKPRILKKQVPNVPPLDD